MILLLTSDVFARLPVGLPALPPHSMVRPSATRNTRPCTVGVVVLGAVALLTTATAADAAAEANVLKFTEADRYVLPPSHSPVPFDVLAIAVALRIQCMLTLQLCALC